MPHAWPQIHAERVVSLFTWGITLNQPVSYINIADFMNTIWQLKAVLTCKGSDQHCLNLNHQPHHTSVPSEILGNHRLVDACPSGGFRFDHSWPGVMARGHGKRNVHIKPEGSRFINPYPRWHVGNLGLGLGTFAVSICPARANAPLGPVLTGASP